MATALLIVHGLVAVALLGRDHPPDPGGLGAGARPVRRRSSAAFAPCRPRPSPTPSSFSMWSRRCSGAILYLYFRVDIRPGLERAGQWPALGLFDIKEHFVSIGLALLPAYWVCWRRPLADEPSRTPRRPDPAPRLRRLVELPDRARPEQHHGLRTMTSLAVVSPVRICLRSRVRGPLRDRAQAGSGPVHRLPVSRRRPSGAPITPETQWRPSMSFLAPAMYWYGWTATAALGALMPGLIAALLPERWTRQALAGLGMGGPRRWRCSCASTSRCLGSNCSRG